MARQKRGSKKFDAAIIRRASLASIDSKLDLGNGLTLANYDLQIGSTKTALDTYNTKLSELDSLLNNVRAEEKKLASLSERMLDGVASKFTKDSNEYEQAGGTKKSEIKRAKKSVVDKKA